VSAPYVSIKRLADNSLAAMLAAVEVYNKPQMTYRDEVTVMLIVNAWELALKATLRQRIAPSSTRSGEVRGTARSPSTTPSGELRQTTFGRPGSTGVR
jgi:hypothetical protein